MDREKLIASIMRECEQDGEPVTREEAEEMADMEIKAGGVKRYEKSDTPRKKAVKERKVDAEKGSFLTGFRVFVEGKGGIVKSIKNEAEFSFSFGENDYTVKLVKHRPPKK